jgi:cobalt/nickel transport protein
VVILLGDPKFVKQIENFILYPFITMGIKSNAFGEFSFGIPKASWWGFCAMGVGPVKEYKGKELSQDAVIWVNAQDME